MVDAPTGAVTLAVKDGQTLIRLSGDVDISLTVDLRTTSRDATETGNPIQVDTADVTFMDSIGAAFLGRLIAAETRHGRRLTVTGASTYIIQAIQLSGLAEFVALQPVP